MTLELKKNKNTFTRQIIEEERKIPLKNDDYNFVFLGQSVLRYTVPLEIFHTINSIYENKYAQLKPANKQLVGKIEKEHSLFFDGPPNNKMDPHNLLTENVLEWFRSKFIHYLNWNKIKEYKYTFKILYGLTKCLNMNINPVHVHQGSIFYRII